MHYGFKLLTTLLLYFPGDTNKIKSRLKTIQKIQADNDDSDRYFENALNKPFLLQVIRFIADNLEHREINATKWREYVSIIDEYLLVGHIDKYHIRNEIKNIQDDFLRA